MAEKLHVIISFLCNNIIVLNKGGRVLKSKVKWFNDSKGFGFIEYDTGADIFVHYSAIKANGYKTLSEGQEVNFDLINTPKGYQAQNVEILKTYEGVK